MYVNNIVAGGINPRISGDDGARRLQKVHPAIDLGADCGWLIGPRKCWPSATAEAASALTRTYQPASVLPAVRRQVPYQFLGQRQIYTDSHRHPPWAHGLAERVWIQQARRGRSHHEQVEAGDRRRVARACGQAPSDRGGGRRARVQPHARAGTPKLRPDSVNPNGIGINAPASLIHAPCYRARQPS